MLLLHFSGWFQCRLATNPDPTDEPRGVSGYTFALAGEPDLDRVIRFQDAICPRSHGPQAGVTIDLVSVDGDMSPRHALQGARVNLLDDPKFESRNLLLTNDRTGTGVIAPFHLQIRADGGSIERHALVYPPDPTRPIHEVPAHFLDRGAPVERDGFTIDPERIARSVGITDPVDYRRRRRRLLESDLVASDDRTERAALAKRIEELTKSHPSDMEVRSLSLTQMRRFALDGPAHVDEGAGVRPRKVDEETAWPIEFWMGAWDADALCGYVSGRIEIRLT